MSSYSSKIYQIDFCSCNKTQQRVDKVLSELSLGLSRSQIAQCCKRIAINGQSVKLSHKVTYQDIVSAVIERKKPSSIDNANGDTANNSEASYISSATEIPSLDILFEDDMLCVVNKARGMVVHPGVGEHAYTLAEIVFDRLSSYTDDSFLHHRAGIIHRLDKDTSGVLVVAKTAAAHELLSDTFANRRVEKQYIAIVKNRPRKKNGSIETLLVRHHSNRKKFTVASTGGKSAITQYALLYTNGSYSVIRFIPHTGRTHQLRVHAQYMGCPIIGDPLYARPIQSMRHVPLMLHAQCLDLSCIASHYVFTAPIPRDMASVMDTIGFALNLY